MCQVTFWTRNDRGGDKWPYGGPRCNVGGAPSDADSLETDADGWLIVFSEPYFGGDHMKVAANRYMPDLNDAHRESGGDWKHRIVSFVLYSDRTFWDAYVPGEPPVAPVNDGEVLFGPPYFECTEMKLLPRLIGAQRIADYQSTPTGSVPDNNIGDLGAIACGGGMYATIFDAPSFGGNCARFAPGSTQYNLEHLSRGDSQSGLTWNRAVRSLYTTDHCPANWHMTLSLQDFEDSFTNHTGCYGYQTGTLEYTTQDCTYRLHYPFQAYPDERTLTVSIEVEHLINLGSNDKMTLQVSFDIGGSIVAVGGTWQETNGGYVIPDWVIQTVDLVAEELGWVEAWATVGISEALADGVILVFDTACAAYNKMVTTAVAISETDGGKYYMIPLAVHTILREALYV